MHIPRGKQLMVRLTVVIALLIPATLVGARMGFAGTPATPNTITSQNISKLLRTKTLYVGCEPSKSLGAAPKSFIFKNKTLKNIHISNENIAVAYTLKRDNKSSFLWVYAKKPGKTKLSFTYKGKKYSINVVTRKWANPVKKLTINKKNVASKYKNRSHYETAIAGKKVTVTPAKGWKLTSLRCGANYTINDFTNGTRVPKPSGTDANLGCSIIARLQQTKTGIEEFIILAQPR